MVFSFLLYNMFNIVFILNTETYRKGALTMGLFEDLSSENNIINKPTKPDEVFASLDPEPHYDYLRGVQKVFLDQWYTRKNEKDLIGILGTGTGKTLIGLLTLQSQLNNNDGPCAYVCPTKQLVNQVVDEAKKFGIKVVTFSKDINRIPSEFTNSDSILVMTFDKLFNGKSVFGVNTAEYIKIGSLVIDDAHTTIKKVQAATTLTICNESEEYNELFSLLKGDLNEQSPAKLDSMMNNDYSNSVMKVPYWTIDSQKQNILRILKNYVQKNDAQFSYPFVLETQDLLDIYVSKYQIDIKPYHVPVDMIPSFSNAKHRLFLSATLSNVGAFISELSVRKKAVENPIRISTLTDTGQKWILACNKINPSYTSKAMRTVVKNMYNKKNNILILVPSTHDANIWENMGATLYSANNISQLKTDFEKESPCMAVLANKYDGIDLPGDLCHFVVLDGTPHQNSLADMSEAQRLPDSKKTISPIVREIEQGMGRAVRSNSDYSLILLLGDKLQDKISSHSQMFTVETQAQWDFFEKISLDIKNKYPNLNESNVELNNLFKSIFKQDSSWIQLYKNNIQKDYKKILSKQQVPDYSFELAERVSWEAAKDKNYNKAAQTIQEYLDTTDSGIAYEIKASFVYKFDKETAFDLQKKAHSENPYLFKSPTTSYYKRTIKKGTEGTNFYKYIVSSAFKNNNDLSTHIRAMNDDLIYANYADEEAFRKSVQNLGLFLGFDSSQPEAETSLKEGGPDNLWLSEEEALVIEDKNQRTSNNIFKGDIEQITTSSTWFKDKYVSSKFCPVLFHPVNTSSTDAHTTLDICVVTESKLEQLKQSINNFADAISQHTIDYWNAENLQKLFNDTKLTKKLFTSTYTVPLKKTY